MYSQSQSKVCLTMPMTVQLQLQLLSLFVCLTVYKCVSVGATVSVIGGGSGFALHGDGRTPRSLSLASQCGTVNPFALTDVTMELWFRIIAPKFGLVQRYQSPSATNNVQSHSLIGMGWQAGYEVEFSDSLEAFQFQTQGLNLANDCFNIIVPINSPATGGGFYGVWHHMAAIFSQTYAVKEFYLDGVLQAAANCTGGILQPSRNEVMVAGRREAAGSPTIGNELYGDVDEVRIWRTRRSAAEILANMFKPIDPSEFSDLVVYLPLDEGQGNVAFDAAHANNALQQINGQIGSNTGVEYFQLQWLPSTAPILGSNIEMHTHFNGPILTIPMLAFRNDTLQLLCAGAMPCTPALAVAEPALQVIVTNATATTLAMLTSADGTAVALNLPLHAPLRIQPPSGTFSLSTVESLSFTFQLHDTTLNALSTASTVNIVLTANLPPVAGRGGYFMYCDGINDFGIANGFSWAPGGGPVTWEVWARTRVEEVQASAMFSVGNTELVGNWCPNNPPGGDVRCDGRFMMHAPWSDKNLGAHYGWVPGVRGSTQIDFNPKLNSWTHIAFTSDGLPGINSGGLAKLYYNGELVGSVPSDGTNSTLPLLGLTLCDWQYWGNLYHWGAFDEFRIYNRVRSQDEILQDMYGGVQSNDPNLLVYYDFNDALNNPNAFLGARDRTGNASHDMVWGACNSAETMTGAHAGLPHCTNANNLTQNSAFFPAQLTDTDDDAWFGDFIFPQYQPDDAMSLFYTNATMPPIVISLNGSDPNGDAIQAVIVTLPNRGNLQTISVWANFAVVAQNLSTPIASASLPYPVPTSPYTLDRQIQYNPDIPSDDPLSVGGAPYDSFNFAITDGLANSPTKTVQIYIPCVPGRYLATNAQSQAVCRPCAPGSYQMTISFNQSCSLCSPATYQPAAGQTGCLLCPTNSYANLAGASSCSSCDSDSLEFPPAPCVENANLPKSYQDGNIIAASVLEAYCVLLMILVAQHRKSRSIYSANLLVLFAVLGGAMMQLAAVYVSVLDQSSSALCHAKYWLWNLGCTAMLAALLGKQLTLHLIFNSRKLQLIDVSVRLKAVIVASLLYDCIVLASWQSPRLGYSAVIDSSTGSWGCDSPSELAYYCTLFIPKAALIVALLALTYQIRDIPSNFNEKLSIVSVCGAYLIGGVVALLTNYATNLTARSKKVTVATIILGTVAITVSVTILTKILRAIQPHDHVDSALGLSSSMVDVRSNGTVISPSTASQRGAEKTDTDLNEGETGTAIGTGKALNAQRLRLASASLTASASSAVIAQAAGRGSIIHPTDVDVQMQEDDESKSKSVGSPAAARSEVATSSRTEQRRMTVQTNLFAIPMHAHGRLDARGRRGGKGDSTGADTPRVHRQVEDLGDEELLSYAVTCNREGNILRNTIERSMEKLQQMCKKHRRMINHLQTVQAEMIYRHHVGLTSRDLDKEFRQMPKCTSESGNSTRLPQSQPQGNERRDLQSIAGNRANHAATGIIGSPPKSSSVPPAHGRFRAGSRDTAVELCKEPQGIGLGVGLGVTALDAQQQSSAPTQLAVRVSASSGVSAIPPL